MADIALLVAEEYERRMKNARKGGTVAAQDHGIGFFSGLSVSAKRVDLEGDIGDFMMKIGRAEEKLDLVTRVLEPRTEIGDAASKCFFSS